MYQHVCAGVIYLAVHQFAELPPFQLVYGDRFRRNRQTGLGRAQGPALREPVRNVRLPFQLHRPVFGFPDIAVKRGPDDLSENPLCLFVFSHHAVIPLRHFRLDIHPVPLLDHPEYSRIVHKRSG